MNPVSELTSYLAALAARLRKNRLFAMVLEVEVISDIVADICACFSSVARQAHRAETNVREALALLRTARQPQSPGGVAVTPCEAEPIQRLLNTSAEAAHDTCELAQVR
jgi:hypothetical protein